MAQDDLGGRSWDEINWKKPSRTSAQRHRFTPSIPISNFNIAYYAQQHGNLEEAIAGYKKAILLTTSTGLKIKAWNNMGLAYRALGDDGQARECSRPPRSCKVHRVLEGD